MSDTVLLAIIGGVQVVVLSLIEMLSLRISMRDRKVMNRKVDALRQSIDENGTNHHL